jgi:hypothetical protein
MTGLGAQLQAKAMQNTVISGRIQNKDMKFYDIFVIFTQ